MKKLLLIILLLGFQNVYALKDNYIQPKISYALWNVDTNTLIDSEGETITRPIASITKLMSVLVILNSGLDLNELLLVTGKESSPYIKRGMLVTRGKLLELSLISSDNLATRTLAETYPGGYSTFIDLMNETAKQLKMENTQYADATGLLSTNVSNSVDISKLVLATQQFPIFSLAANTTSFITEAIAKIKNRAKTVLIKSNNTNQFAGKLDIISAKTGYTSKAGRCLTMLFNHNGSRYLLVVMGAQTPTERKKVVEKLLNKI